MLEAMKHRPIQRSKARLLAGKWWFTIKRYASWLSPKIRIAKDRSVNSAAYCIFTHRTPLFRELKEVDRWLHNNKAVNLKLAAGKLDGLLLKPGETFSYWRTIGKPTRSKGYVEGMVLFYGGFKTGVGGGLCQMSNLIYWMTLHTPLTVTERHRHSYDVFPDVNRTQPFGSGATCAYNYLDLQIKNTTDTTYQLRVRVSDNELIGEWRAELPEYRRYEVYEKEHLMASQPWGGYIRSNVIHRRTFNSDNQLIADEYVSSNNALMMYAPLLEQPV